MRAVERFIDKGASFVGGCYGIGPEEIACLSAHQFRTGTLAE